MKGKKINIRVLSRIMAFLLIAIALIAFAMNGSKESNISCSEISILMKYEDGIELLKENEVRNIINNYCKNDSVVDAEWITGLERVIENNPFVLEADIFKSLTGSVRTKVAVKQPLLRVYSSTGAGYYIDNFGNTIPLSYNDAARVIVANGHIRTGYFNGNIFENDSLPDIQYLRDLHQLVTWINTKPFWQAQIEQIYLNAQKDIELIPKVGMNTIVLGELKNFEKKFNKLEYFYREVLSKGDWNLCSVLDLRFKNQIVCKQI